MSSDLIIRPVTFGVKSSMPLERYSICCGMTLCKIKLWSIHWLFIKGLIAWYYWLVCWLCSSSCNEQKKFRILLKMQLIFTSIMMMFVWLTRSCVKLLMMIWYSYLWCVIGQSDTSSSNTNSLLDSQQGMSRSELTGKQHSEPLISELGK